MSSASESLSDQALQVVTRAGDALAAETIARLTAEPGARVRVFDLTVPQPDYDALLDAIFAADAVAVW
jgi:hypothetical protein